MDDSPDTGPHAGGRASLAVPARAAAVAALVALAAAASLATRGQPASPSPRPDVGATPAIATAPARSLASPASPHRHVRSAVLAPLSLGPSLALATSARPRPVADDGEREGILPAMATAFSRDPVLATPVEVPEARRIATSSTPAPHSTAHRRAVASGRPEPVPVATSPAVAIVATSESAVASVSFASTPDAPSALRSMFAAASPTIPVEVRPVLAYAPPEGGVPVDGSAPGVLGAPFPGAPSPEPGGAEAATAVYDISARLVTLPDGTRLEAHSGLGPRADDARFVRERMRGPTPPALYEVTLRPGLFHGIQALRLHPSAGGAFGRTGLLAHPYMLHGRPESNGCVVLKDYDALLRAFVEGRFRRLRVVPGARGGQRLAAA